MNINLSDNQVQQIADSVANSQKVKANLTDFQNELQNISQNVSSSNILDQIISFIQELFNYAQGIISQQ